jgi:CSLREA domain-containing protein
VLGVAVVVTLGAAGSAQAATITVDTTSDTYSQHDSHCSLRDAIQAVDTQTTFGTCPAGTGGDTIVLRPGSYQLTIAPTGSDDNSTGDLNISTGVTIDGSGATINAGKIDRIFDISTSDPVMISGLKLTDGLAPTGATGDSTPSAGGPGGNGGAILSSAPLTLANVTIEDSTAGTGGTGGTTGGMFPTGASGGDGGNGGGVYSSAPLTLKQVTMAGDKAGVGGTGGADFPFGAAGGIGGEGGAIGASAPLTITGGTFSNDVAGAGTGGSVGGGGGAVDAGGTLALIDATFASDVAGAGGSSIFEAGPGGGGGAIDAGATATIAGSKFASNGSGASGGAGLLTASSSGAGGAILAAGKLTLQQDSFSHNSTAAGPSSGLSGGSGSGGAVEATSGLSVGHSTFASNLTGAAGGTGSSAGAAGGSGGAIDAARSTTITTSTFTGNATGAGGSASSGAGGPSGDGGAISLATGALDLAGSTLTGNAVGAPGTGSSAGTPGSGNAVEFAGNKALLVNDTLTRNGTASVQTGTVSFAGSATATLESVTDVANQGLGVTQGGSAGVALIDTLLSANSPQNCSGTITDQGHNLSFPATDTSCPATFSHGNPKLASALARNGGSTETLALLPGSAAIDAGPTSRGTGCPVTDQRGVPRPQGRACDIGAFEFGLPSITITKPAAGATYRRGRVVRARYRCSEGGRSGFVARCSGPVASGKPIPTSTVGRKTFTVTALDLVGEKTTKTVIYTVIARRSRQHARQ